MSDSEPVLPDYQGPCLSNVVPALLQHDMPPPVWLPEVIGGAHQIVLLAIDGLGSRQLASRKALAPALTSMSGDEITTVAPSTTAAALTSLVVGCPPGEHGIIGYRMNMDGDVLNVLRWQVAAGDARKLIVPQDVQMRPAFGGRRPPVVTKAEFVGTGFTDAHLSNIRFHGWRQVSTLVTEVRRLLVAGEPFIYAYYEGLDKVAHEFGLGEHFDAELVAVDRLVADVASTLPAGAVLVVTSDHGQVDVGDGLLALDDDVMAHVALLSGEGRFRWLHAKPGASGDLAEAAREAHGDQAWVATRAETIADEWFGPKVGEVVASRLGDVLLAAREPVAFADPADSGPFRLVSRHGSLTADEMMIPLLALRG